MTRKSFLKWAILSVILIFSVSLFSLLPLLFAFPNQLDAFSSFPVPPRFSTSAANAGNNAIFIIIDNKNGDIYSAIGYPLGSITKFEKISNLLSE